MEQAPKFTLIQLDENTPWSLDQVKSKLIMLTFWTSWCPDSQRDLRVKQTLYESIKSNESMEMIMIHVTGRDPEVDVSAYLKRNSYTFPVLTDQGTTVYDQYLCNGVPTTVLINKKKEIAYKYDEQASIIDIMHGVTTLLS